MLKLKNQKGSSIIELLCSITIFSILIINALSIQLLSIRLAQYNQKTEYYSYFLEALKNHIIYNSTFEQIKELRKSNMYYINKENIDTDKLKQTETSQLFTSDHTSGFPYVKLTITGEQILKLNLELHTKFMQKEKIIRCELYKGNY